MRRIASRSARAAIFATTIGCGSAALAQDRLYALGADRLLIGTDGRAHRFRSMPAEPPWQGTVARFRTDDQRLALLGTDGRYRLTDASGRVRELQIATLPEATAIHPAPADCPNECDGRMAPPADFDRTTSPVGAVRLDLRPASCRSYFIDFPPIERGARIETAIAAHSRFSTYEPTVRSFPSVDLIGEHDLIMVRSLDLATTSVSATGGSTALYDEILADVERLDRQVLAPLRDGVTLEVRDGAEVTRLSSHRESVYTLVVRYGVLDAGQAAQIQLARLELALRFDVRLDIIEIP